MIPFCYIDRRPRNEGSPQEEEVFWNNVHAIKLWPQSPLGLKKQQDNPRKRKSIKEKDIWWPNELKILNVSLGMNSLFLQTQSKESMYISVNLKRFNFVVGEENRQNIFLKI